MTRLPDAERHDFMTGAAPAGQFGPHLGGYASPASPVGPADVAADPVRQTQFEREAAVLDLADAAQATALACAAERAGEHVAARAHAEQSEHLYRSADRHRQLALWITGTTASIHNAR